MPHVAAKTRGWSSTAAKHSMQATPQRIERRIEEGFDWSKREVLVAVVDGFEFAAIDGDAGVGQMTKFAAQFGKASADLSDGGSGYNV